MLHERFRALAPLALLGFLALPAQAQGACSGPTDPSHPNFLEQKVIWRQLLDGKYQPPAGDPGNLIAVPVKFHVTKNTSGTTLSPPPDQTELSAILAELNTAFAQAGIYFYQQQDVDVILDNALHTITCQQSYNTLVQTNNAPQTVDLYFVHIVNPQASCPPLVNCCTGISPPAFSGPSGIATWTASPYDAVVIRNCNPVCQNGTCACPDNELVRRKVVVHEVGHYFDLLHPNETAFGVECTSASTANCTTCGDFVCDTPAEPVPSTYSFDPSTCQASGFPAPPCGATPYAPDVTNYMNNKAETRLCRDHLTFEQSIRARATLLNLRPELVP